MSGVIERISSALSSLGKRKPENSDPALQPPAKQQQKQQAVQFRPWEQQDFVRRLETYRPLTWFAKPGSVDPLACASKGWINESRDSLCCEFCHNKLIWPQKVAFETRDKAAELFLRSLSGAHGAHCPWRSKQCEDVVLAFRPTPDMQQQFQRRQDSLMGIDMLPDVDGRSLQDIMEVDKDGFERLILPPPQHSHHRRWHRPPPQRHHRGGR